MEISRMTTVSVGDRVGAILSMNADSVHLLGYGVYEGEYEPPFIKEMKNRGEVPEADDYRNPKIKLDDGRIVWGFQCWWGTEEKIRTKIGERKIVPATIG